MASTENSNDSNTQAGIVAATNNYDTKAKLSELQVKLDKLQGMLDNLEDEVRVRGKVQAGCGPAGIDAVCKSCLVRKKGVALFPCGHIICWECSSDLKQQNSSCPSCDTTTWSAQKKSQVP
jgi:hypothetical protein